MQWQKASEQRGPSSTALNVAQLLSVFSKSLFGSLVSV